MNRKLFSTLTALMWSALPLNALPYRQVWNRLPARMATHLAAHGQPNGWMPREVSLCCALGLTAFTLMVFTGIASVRLRHKAAPDPPSLAWLGFFYLIQVFVFYVNNRVIDHNLDGRPATLFPVLLGVPIAVLWFALIYLHARSGPSLPERQTLAGETHGSMLFAVLFLALAAAQFLVVPSVPQTGVRLAVGPVGVLFLLIAAHAWDGFHYRFTPIGLEIGTLGLRLRSIPQSQIASYRIEKCGNNVVPITTSEGEVFLGHNDPARIVRGLDMMKQLAHS
jgi:hypothetical protein